MKTYTQALESYILKHLSPLSSRNSLLLQAVCSSQPHRKCHPLILALFLLGSILQLQRGGSETVNTDSWIVAGRKGECGGKQGNQCLDQTLLLIGKEQVHAFEQGTSLNGLKWKEKKPKQLGISSQMLRKLGDASTWTQRARPGVRVLQNGCLLTSNGIHRVQVCGQMRYARSEESLSGESSLLVIR